MDTARVVIQLEDITFAYVNDRKVLDHLHFELRQGDRIGLMGPTGSGKTTLFHVIMGLLKPSSGRIELFGRPARTEKDFRSVRTRIGLLFQDADDQLFSPTVLEDVAFGPLNMGKGPEEARAIAADVLSRLNLSGFEERITYKLSGGEKRLVSLATVFAMEPEILLLDEPVNGLDRETEEKIIAALRDLNLTSVVISHNLDFLTRVTDRIHAMSAGKIVLDEEVVPHYHLHAHQSGDLPHEHDS